MGEGVPHLCPAVAGTGSSNPVTPKGNSGLRKRTYGWIIGDPFSSLLNFYLDFQKKPKAEKKRKFSSVEHKSQDFAPAEEEKEGAVSSEDLQVSPLTVHFIDILVQHIRTHVSVSCRLRPEK